MPDLLQYHSLNCDVLVAGGGPAGVPAAIAAARAGANVILCHDRPVLGGNASSEVRMHIVGANFGRQDKDWSLESRETGIIEEIRLENAMRNPQRSASMMDLILYEKCRAEPNLTLLLNTRVQTAETENDQIVQVGAVRDSTEDHFSIKAGVYIDCTGDGGLGAAAGALFVQGREGKEAHGESMAQDKADKKTLGSTLLFMARKHDTPMPFTAPAWVRRFTKEDFNHRATFWSGDFENYEYGYWWLEWGGQLDTIKDNEIIRDELLSILLGVWHFIKNEGDHGAENWALDWFGTLPGKRESRRFVGQHTLNENDLMEARPFADAIAYGGWPIDLHPPEGIDRPEEAPCRQIKVPYLFEIPLRACISKNIKNLMFAGRNISATHVAFASTRVMATCAIMGEGVGVAAAHAVREGIAPHALAESSETMDRIQQHLLKEDLFLIGQTNRGERDHARTAHITASSEHPDGPAINVISGQTRSVQTDRGVRPDRLTPGSHRWMSAPSEPLPAWLEFRWDAPIEISRLDLTFDTGLQRYLTQTHSDEYFKRMIWRNQPETVKDFSIEIEEDGQWREIERVEGNWKRRFRKNFQHPQSATALRVIVRATGGLDHARIVAAAIY